MIALDSTPLGDSHDRLGFTELYVTSPTVRLMPSPNDFDRAITAKTARTTSSVPSSSTCDRAESSMPFQQIHVMATMNRMPMTVVSQMLFAAFSSNSSTRY